VQKVRIETKPNTAQTGSKQWKIQIDGLQFLGGMNIDPFASYAENLAAIDYALRLNGQTGVGVSVTTAINNATPNDVALPPYQVAVVGDAIYFCGLDMFTTLKLKVDRAAVYIGITMQWQYWNGSAWTALITMDGSNYFQNDGTHFVLFMPPSNWTKTSLWTINGFWIRCIVTALNSPSITTTGLAGQGWLETGENPPFIDSSSIALNGVHCMTAQDTLIDSFEYASREKWRLLNNLHLPIPTMDITVPVLSNLVHPSDLVTVTVPQLNITSQLWRMFHIHYEWDTSNKRIYQTLHVTQQTKPLPPLWAQQPELRMRVR
jgi:hypothetical protein